MFIYAILLESKLLLRVVVYRMCGHSSGYKPVPGGLHCILFIKQFFWFILNRSDMRHIFGSMPAEGTKVREVGNILKTLSKWFIEQEDRLYCKLTFSTLLENIPKKIGTLIGLKSCMNMSRSY